MGRSWRDVDAELAEREQDSAPEQRGLPRARGIPPGHAEPDSEVGEFLEYSLEPGDFNTPRFEGLTSAQGAAILAFLRLDLEV